MLTRVSLFLFSFLGWGVGWKLVVLVIMIFAVDNNCGSLQNRPWIKEIYCIEWWLLFFFFVGLFVCFFFQAWWKIMILNQIHAKCKNKLHDVSGSWQQFLIICCFVYRPCQNLQRVAWKMVYWQPFNNLCNLHWAILNNFYLWQLWL